MLPQQTKLEVISNNLANAQTAGFKRSGVFERNLIDARENLNNVPGDVEESDPPIGSYVDFSKGAFEQTGNKLDLAIENDNSFFTVEDENGTRYLTRSGHFTLSPDGNIVTTDGKFLIGQNGPININPYTFYDPQHLYDTKTLNITVTETGDVFVNDNLVGELQLVKVDNPETLEPESNASFLPTDETTAEQVQSDDMSIRQGWLEDSNVDMIMEMVSMIELQRLFEVGQKVITTNNDTLTESLAVGRYY